MTVSNVGSQNISMKFHAARTSAEINRRFKGVRPTGIYSGGYLTVANTTHATLSPVVAEISDRTYQIRAETTTSVTITVGASTPYIVLRWTYTGSESDYMEILALAYGSLQANDIIVGNCTFSSGNLIGFSYANGESISSVGSDLFWFDNRNYAITSNNFLKVINDTPARNQYVVVLPGRVQTVNGAYDVPWQKVHIDAPANILFDRIDLIYFDTDTNTIQVLQGTEAPSTVVAAPDYLGKLVIAEVCSFASDTTSCVIRDVRSFLTAPPLPPDGVTIEEDSDGNLKTVDPVYLIKRSYGGQLVNQSTWTTITDLGTELKKSGISSPAIDGTFTLLAGKTYRLNYTILYKGLSGNPIVGARIRVLTGDLSWEFRDDGMNRSRQNVKIQTTTVTGDNSGTATLSGSYLFIPTSTSTFQLQVMTADSTGAYGEVFGVEFEIQG